VLEYPCPRTRRRHPYPTQGERSCLKSSSSKQFVRRSGDTAERWLRSSRRLGRARYCEVVKRAGIDPGLSRKSIWAAPIRQAKTSQRGAHGAAASGPAASRRGRHVQPAVRQRVDSHQSSCARHQVRRSQVFIAGGVESMSRAPYSLPRPNRPTRGATSPPMIRRWLALPEQKMEAMFPLEQMGETAENIAASTRNHARDAGRVCVRQSDARQSGD